MTAQITDAFVRPEDSDPLYRQVWTGGPSYDATGTGNILYGLLKYNGWVAYAMLPVASPTPTEREIFDLAVDGALEEGKYVVRAGLSFSLTVPRPIYSGEYILYVVASDADDRILPLIDLHLYIAQSFRILKENGSFMLKENGDKILKEHY